ncbi:6-bladed beta-propeller [Puteibacter caeruleilacunae]|nr:6-bladed beta-propeller [Puteibacter caeruleilacunae]
MRNNSGIGRLIKVNVLIALAIIMCCACVSNSKKAVKLPEILLTSELRAGKGNIDYLISKTEFVPLETNSRSLFKEISKLFICGDTLIVGDYKLGKVLLFGRDGSYISSFSHLGRGPGEYGNIQDITFDEKNRTIFICDFVKRKIHNYKLDGLYLNSSDINIKNAGEFFYSYLDYFVFYRHNQIFPAHSNSNLVITDKKQKYIRSGITIPETIRNLSFLGNSFMSSSDSCLYVYPCFKDTIFQIDPQLNIVPKFSVKIEEKLDVKQSHHWDKRYKSSSEFFQTIHADDFIWQTSDFYALSNYIVFKYLSNSGYSLVIYSKEDDTTRIFTHPSVTKGNFLFTPIGRDGDCIVVNLAIADNVERVNKFVDSKIDLNSNPVLCFITLKKSK